LNKNEALKHTILLKARQVNWPATALSKLIAVKIVVTSSPLYKLTFFPTECQTNQPHTSVIPAIEERA